MIGTYEDEGIIVLAKNNASSGSRCVTYTPSRCIIYIRTPRYHQIIAPWNSFVRNALWIDSREMAGSQVRRRCRFKFSPLSRCVGEGANPFRECPTYVSVTPDARFPSARLATVLKRTIDMLLILRIKIRLKMMSTESDSCLRPSIRNRSRIVCVWHSPFSRACWYHLYLFSNIALKENLLVEVMISINSRRIYLIFYREMFQIFAEFQINSPLFLDTLL